MAQWQRLNSFCQQNRSINESVMEIYTRMQIPYKIRSHFCDWIEAQNWSIDITSKEGNEKAQTLFIDLELKMKDLEDSMHSSVPYDLEKVRDIRQARQEIKKLPYDMLVKAMNHCLQEEKMLLESYCPEKNETKPNRSELGSCSLSERLPEIKEKLLDMFKQIAMAESRVSVVSQEQEKLLTVICQQNEEIASMQRNNARDYAITKKAIEADQGSLVQAHSLKRNAMADDLIQLAIRLAYLLQMIWSEIRKWQHEQKQVVVGLALPKKGSLDALDTLCEEGGQVLNRIILQVEKILVVFKRFPIQGSAGDGDDGVTKLELVYSELLNDYLPKHLLCVFIVEQSVPNGILCVDGGKSGSFRITVRILGGRAFGLGFSRPVVKMSLLNKTGGGCASEASGTLGDCAFSVDSVTGRCRAEFQGVHIENMQSHRSSSGSGGKYDKFAFVFHTMVHVCGCEIPLQASSHPVIVTCTTSDEVFARGVLVWDAAFPETSRKQLASRDVVRWSEFAQVLNTLFLTNTGRGLDQAHLDYLARFLFSETKNVDLSNRNIRERQAIWDNMSGRKFSFWTWCWANISVVRDIVNAEWKAGLIYGFISKEDARSKLLDSPCGTFLLRFSESEIDSVECRSGDSSGEQRTDVYGHLTIAVNEYDNNGGRVKKLYYIKDYLSPKHIKEKSLCEILGAMEVVDGNMTDGANPSVKKQLLKHLWPDTKKDFNSLFYPFRPVSSPIHSSDDNEDENGYKGSKFTIEIFLNESVADRTKGNGNVMHRQDSISSVATSAHSSMNDISIDEANTNCASSSPTPTYRLVADATRPTATVRPQPALATRSVMPQPPRQLLPPQVIVPHVLVYQEDTDDDSMDTVYGGGGHAGPGLPTGFSGTIASEFAAFHLHGGNG